MSIVTGELLHKIFEGQRRMRRWLVGIVGSVAFIAGFIAGVGVMVLW